MKQRNYIVVLLLFAGFTASAQKKINISTAYSATGQDTVRQVPLRVLPARFYTCNTGFFCKMELKVEKTLRLPLRVRLGSVAYCDAMEGKNGGHP